MDRPTPRRAVMIAAGGTWQDRWLIDMLSLLVQIDPRAMLWVLSGRRLSAGKIARQAGLCRGRIRFFSGLQPTEMLQLYRRARYLVAPASTVMLEAFAAGCPIISGWIAENQRNSLGFYERQGLIVNVGDLRSISRGSLIQARSLVQREGSRMIRRQRAYIAAAQTGMEEIVHAVLARDNIA